MGFRIRKIGTVMMVSALSLLYLSACAGVGKRLEPPRVTLANIQVEEVKAFETVFQIELRVINTNEVPITIKGVDCDLELNGRKFASGVSRVEKEIPSYGTDTLPIKLYSSVLDIFRSVLSLPGKETLKYLVKGRVRLGGGPLVPSTVPFKSEGELSLEGLKSPPS